ncbi:MAG TPA: hypothetical protein VMS54_03975 [Vicinamibacterales bacterium]|nr:hypothetical protein [Vicinamibacterales bacterium]
MDSISKLLRAIIAGSIAVWLVLSATSAFAQGMFFKEIEKDGRIYVFNIQANAERFEKTGEMGISITMMGAGPNGETVTGDNEKALQLYFYKHNLQVVVADPPPPAPTALPWRISGLVFGDYYYFGDSQPQAAFQEQQGMWIRRAYLTYDHTFSPAVTTRFRLEANGNGRLVTPAASATPFIKDAYVRWTFHGRQQLTIGIQPSLTFDYIEGFWGLRHIEKTPLDLYGTDSSRDTGFTVAGPINTSGSMRYAYQFGNESGNNNETDKFKAQRATFRFEKNPGFAVEGLWMHADRQPNPTPSTTLADRETGQIFLGWRNQKARVGFQYTFQKREAADNAPATVQDMDLNIYSGFGVFEMPRQKVSFYLRLDRYDDPCVDCGGIAYFPAAINAAFTTTIAGMEYYILPSVRVGPNFEYTKYSDPVAGTKPNNMSVARLTFYWVW